MELIILVILVIAPPFAPVAKDPLATVAGFLVAPVAADA